MGNNGSLNERKRDERRGCSHHHGTRVRPSRCTSYRAQRLAGPRGPDPRRVAPNDLQPHSRGTVANDSDHRRIAAGAARFGAGSKHVTNDFRPRDPMATPRPLLSQLVQIATRTTAIAICTLAAAAPARAQQHHARLSADLADHLTAQSARIDVIVHGEKAEVDAIAARYNLTIRRYLKGGAVLRVNAGQLSALERDDAVDHLSGDTIIRAKADVTAESIGADQVWAGDGDLRPLNGSGVTVAVIDTGIDTRHQALKKRVIFSKDFTGGEGMDRFGHGTHVAGIIAGAGGKSADTKDYRGIAFGANLVNLRALGDDGSGTVSTVVDAMDWAVDHQHEFNIRVINLSLGTPVLQPYRDDPLCEAVERAVSAGIVVVVAAGNGGRDERGRTVLGSINSPANSPYAIAVAALDTHDTAK